MQFHIENMTCGGCAKGVTAAIRALDPSATVEADPAKRSVKVKTTTKRDDIEKALAEAGFAARAA